jgi:peptidoglycan/xylan/chitin deacetylase (PgdA/CDA1 family)
MHRLRLACRAHPIPCDWVSGAISLVHICDSLVRPKGTVCRPLFLVAVTALSLAACGGGERPDTGINTAPLAKQTSVAGITFQSITLTPDLLVKDDDIASVSVDVTSDSINGFDIVSSETGEFVFRAYKPGSYPIKVVARDHEYEVEFTVLLNVAESSCVADFQGKNIILSYDDSPLSDYQLILPIHRVLDIPGEIGVNTDRIFEISNNDRHITINQLLELKQAGFEILSHGAGHHPLSKATLLKPVRSGEAELRTNLDSLYLNAWKTDYEWILSGGAERESIDIITSRSSGDDSYIELVMPLINSFPAYSVFYPSEIGMDIEMLQSRKILEHYDLGARHISYPFGLSDDFTVGFSRRYGYETGRDAIPHVNRFAVETLYIDSIPDPFEIASLDFAYLSEEFLNDKLSKSDSPNQFIIFFSHSWDPNLTEAKLYKLVEIAKKNGFQFTTRSESLNLTCSRLE